jgi:DNA-binding MarR family transcriptional regulator
MSELIAPMQKSGLISSAPDPNDRRQTLMSLTPKCVAWIAKGKTASQDWMSKVISERLTLQEQRQLSDALKLLQRVAGES